MKRKGLIILISILTLALIVTAVVILTPSEKQQQLSFTGVKIDNKGQVLDECSITWNTTYKDGPLSDPTYYEVSAAIEGHYDLPYSLSTADPSLKPTTIYRDYYYYFFQE